MREWILRSTSTLFILLACGAIFAGSPIWNYWPTGNATNQASAPTYSPTGYTSECGQNTVVTVSTSTAFAKIRYNLASDGTTPADPTCSSGTLINATSGTFTAVKWVTNTVKAVSYTTCSGTPDTSSVSTSIYDFSGIDCGPGGGP